MRAETKTQAAWIAYWSLLARYHRYTVEGLDELLDQHKHTAVLFAGYHGRPLAYDMCMLTVKIHERLGYLPHGIMHRSVLAIPKLGRLVESLGFVTGDGAELEAAVERREHIVTTPGGAAEGCRSVFDNYRVNWGDRAGYIKLAIRRRIPIVPVACAGADGAYIGLWNGEKMAARFGLSPKLGWATWGGLGLLGPYPLSPPIPVRMRQLIGEPIDVSHVDPGDRTAIARMHDEFTRRLQALLDRARNSKR